jgi:hypothetical protein
MPSLDTTNLILAVIALSVFVQTAMLVAVALWLRSQVTAVTDKFATLAARAEGVNVAALTARTTELMDDLHDVSMAAKRAAREIERTAKGAQVAVSLVGHQVERATGGVRVAFDVIEAVTRRASAVSSGIKEGVKEGVRALMTPRPNGAPRRKRLDEPVAWMENGHA